MGNNFSFHKEFPLPINSNQTSLQQDESSLSPDLITKIHHLENSNSLVCFTFSDQVKSIFRRWSLIRILCQDFEIKNNQLFIINEQTNTMIIHQKISSFDSNCFSECSMLKIILPNSITSLGNGCFQSCSNLTLIILPNSITSFGEKCFYYYSNLFQPEFSNFIVSIHDLCFYQSNIYPTIIKNQLIRDFSSIFVL
jgi:hypothetical protein